VFLSFFSFPDRSSFLKRYPGLKASGVSRCSSYYPCRLRFQQPHTMTFAVLARKRARPIYQTGRRRPQGAYGHAPFQIVSIHRFQGFKVRGFKSV
jgi:hypothetical protein